MRQLDANSESEHRRSSNHRQQVLASAICGCFYCCKTFSPGMVSEWVDEETTALCPYCGIDSVLPFERPDQVGEDLLHKMHDYWFS